MKPHIKHLLICSWALAFGPARPTMSPAASLTQDIVRPFEQELELCRAGLTEIDRQANQQIAEQQAWIAYYQNQRTVLGERTEKVKKDWEDRIDRIGKAMSALGGLEKPDGNAAHLPHFGWTNQARLSELLKTTQEEYEKVSKSIAEGDYKIHHHILGWISGKILDEKITKTATEIKNIQEAVSQGKHSVHLSGMGWITRNALEARMAAAEKSKTETMDTIAKGEYSVHVPVLGWHTRNSLQKAIEAVEAKIEGLGKTAQDEKLGVHRALLGWCDALTLAARLEAKSKEIESWKKSVEEDIFSAHIPANGWMSGKDIKAKIESVAKSIEGIEKAVADGTYGVPVKGFNWMNKQQIEAAEDNINRQLGDPKLTAAVKKALREQLKSLAKGLKDIANASALDVAVWLMEKSKWTSWATAYAKLAVPYLEAKRLESRQLADGPHAARDGAEVIWRQWTAGKKCVDEAGRRAIRVVWNRLLDKTLPKAERDFTTTAAWRIINPPPLSKQPAVPS